MMNKFLVFLKKLLINILILPYTILKFINNIFNNNIRKVKFSIKRKITFNYIMLYFISCIFTLIIVISGYLYLEHELFIPKKINVDESLLKECTTDLEIKDTIRKIAVYRDSDIIIAELDDNIVYASDDNLFGIPYPETKIQFFEFIKENKKLPYKEIISLNNKFHKIFYYFNVSSFTNRAKILALLVGAGELFGLFIIWLFGSHKSKKVLKPIYTMTTMAKDITIYNMDARLNISEAKYELKDLAYTLNKMLDSLKTDYTKQKRFVSDVSHELRTPISIIDGYASMLQRWGKKDEEVLNESIEAIKNEAENMKDLVENLLFLARHDNQTLEYNMENFYIDELLNEVIKETGIIDKKHIIEHTITPNVLISGDKNRLKQAIRIFVDNAIKYTPPSGKIIIKSYKTDTGISVSIKDTGIGISREDLGNIFNRFYRSDKSRTRQTGGHGLGLSIAKIIVLGHKGKIKVRSKLGIGTEIIITIPTSIPN
ncbi:sensor histidine kinase [Vallitalea guaymasensis]|uniref:sensor histidine kinase n=1 Tax=Vallitalea guaymasensis TaxID=1185412 RepID=UPI000DE2E8CB|nr:ATP-binding protein [Vallitalea guaymasensis]